MRKTKNFNISVPELGDRPDITQVSNAIQSLEDALAGTVEMFDGNVQGNILTLTSPSRTTKRTKYYNGFTCQWVAKAPYNANTITNVNVDGLGNQAVTIGFNIRQGDAIQLKHNGSRFEVVTLNIPRSNSETSSSDFTIATSLAVKKVNDKITQTNNNKLDKGGYTGTAQSLKNDIDTKANKNVSIFAGSGLSLDGTSDLTGNKTINIYSANSGIRVNADNIELMTLDSIASTDKIRPASANSVKLAYDKGVEALNKANTKVDKTTQIIAGNGLDGGGSLGGNITINLTCPNDSLSIFSNGVQVNCADTLASDSSSKPLSARRGKELNTNKLDKGGYSGTAQSLKTEIDKNKWYIGAKSIGSTTETNDLLGFARTAEPGFYKSELASNKWTNLPPDMTSAFTLTIVSIQSYYRSIRIRSYTSDLEYLNTYCVLSNGQQGWVGWSVVWTNKNFNPSLKANIGYSNGPVLCRTANYFDEEQYRDLAYSGFYRANGKDNLPSLMIHCAHSAGKGNSGGIGLSYAGFGTYRYAFSGDGSYLGKKEIWGEWNFTPSNYYTKSESDGRYYTMSSSDTRYLQDIRFTGMTLRTQGENYATSKEWAGGVIVTSCTYDENANLLRANTRQFQKYKNGAWVTVTY